MEEDLWNMKKIDLNLLFAISFLALFPSCAEGQYIKNPEKELKAEKIYVKRDGDKVTYNIKIYNISGNPMYLGIKSFSDLSPDGEICEYSEEKNFLHLIYTMHKVTSYYNEKDKTGAKYVLLRKNEPFVFSGTIEPKKCKLQADKYAPDYNATNIPEDKTAHLVFSISYFKKLTCKNNKDCELIKSTPNFTLWDDESLEKQIFGDGFIVSQFIFEFDHNQKD